MKKMIYTKELDEQIISHEDHMLALYLEKIKEYKPLFEGKRRLSEDRSYVVVFPE